MKIPSRSAARLRRGQYGLTLIEMSVTILIALFLLAGLFTMVQSTRRTYTNQAQLAQLQDAERMAMTLMADVIESAGYFPDPHTNTSSILPSGGAWATAQPVLGTAPGGNLDTITVRFATKPGDTVVNCLGNSNPTGSGTTIMYTNTFSLSAPDAAGNRSLQCTLVDSTGVTTGPVSLVYGVQSMQIYYGIQRNSGADANDNNVDTYLLANEMSTSDTTNTNPSPKNDWLNVTAVRVILTFKNPLAPPSATAAQQTIKFDRVIAVMNRAGVAS